MQEVGSKAAGEGGEETPGGGNRKKERQEEQQRRLAAERWEEREWKFERVRRAKATMEENPDALRKGKWPRCTQ